MANRVVITADSPCDMTPELCLEFGIETIPLTVTLGEQDFLDGVDIFPDDIYEYYERTGNVPKTAAINPYTYTELFEKHVEQGADIVHISLSSKISSTYQNAVLGAEDYSGVFVVDSLSLTTGFGLLVIRACELRDKGLSAKEIAERLVDIRRLINTHFVIDTVDYLYKGGRCSALAAVGASVLGIKPAIHMVDGLLTVRKVYLGKAENAYKQMIRETLHDASNVDDSVAFLEHTGVDAEILDRLSAEILKIVKFKRLIVSRAGCTITAHGGPRTVGFLFMNKGR